MASSCPIFLFHYFAAKVFLLQFFWGFEGVVGTMIWQADDAFLVAVGIGGNVFNRNSTKYGCLVTGGT